MPNVTETLPALGDDPWGPKLVAWAQAMQAALNTVISSVSPPALGPVASPGTATGQAAAADHIHPTTGLATTQDLADAVIGAGGTPATRTITTGTGLSGGGTLEQDRTFAVVFGSTSGTVCEGNDPRLGAGGPGDITAAALTDYILSAMLATDLVHRIRLRADGTIAMGGPTVAVSNVTGTSTVTVTTAADHSLGTGDDVVISGVQSFSGANGEFTITRTSDTQFTLDGATGSGSYTTGGTVQRIIGGTGSALEGIWNLLTDGSRDGIVVRATFGDTHNMILCRDPSGAPIFVVPTAGGPAVMGDNFRVFAGGDIINSEVNLKPDGTIRGRKGDPAGGAGVLAFGNVTTEPSGNPDGTHTVDGATTEPGVAVWSRDGRWRLRTSAGHEDELLAPVHRHAASVAAPGADTTLVVTGALPPAVATINITATVDDQAAGPQVKYTTTAASGVDAGVISAVGVFQRRWAPYFHARIQTDASAITSTRLVVGLVSADVAADAGPASTGAYTVASGAWLRYDTAVDGTAFWRAVTSDATTATVTTTTVAVAADTSYELAIEINAAGTSIRFWVGGVLAATHTANLPAASTALAYTARLRTLAAAARALRLAGVGWSQKR